MLSISELEIKRTDNPFPVFIIGNGASGIRKKKSKWTMQIDNGLESNVKKRKHPHIEYKNIVLLRSIEISHLDLYMKTMYYNIYSYQTK